MAKTRQDVSYRNSKTYRSPQPDVPFRNKPPFRDPSYLKELERLDYTRLDVNIKAIAVWDTVGKPQPVDEGVNRY